MEDERLAAIKKSDPSVADFDEQIRQAKTEEIEACRAYYFHVRQHDRVLNPPARSQNVLTFSNQ